MENKEYGKDLAIVIYSCWKNRDMWDVFSKLFKKYWKDCAYQVVLVTDEYHETACEYVFDKIVQIDDTWGNMILEAINQAATQYVMLWMDDYLLCDYVSNSDVRKQLNRAIEFQAANYRLVESPKCNGLYQDKKDVGYYQRGTAYSLSTQVGIWDTDFLKKVIQRQWSAWEFERIASLREDSLEQPVLVSLDYVFPYEEGVRKGKWMVAGAKLCERNGIKIDTSRRPIMTNWDMAKIYFQGAIIDWNPTLVVKIQNLFNKVIK